MRDDEDRIAAGRLQIEDDMRMLVSDPGDPYPAGSRIWGTAFGLAADSPDLMWPMWLIWGALTDWVDAKPAETVEAHEAMRRAAREWLHVSADPSAHKAYFEKWVYDELEYERPHDAE